MRASDVVYTGNGVLDSNLPSMWPSSAASSAQPEHQVVYTKCITCADVACVAAVVDMSRCAVCVIYT